MVKAEAMILYVTITAVQILRLRPQETITIHSRQTIAAAARLITICRHILYVISGRELLDKREKKGKIYIMYLLINDEYGQEIAAVQYDEEKEKLKDVSAAARKKKKKSVCSVSKTSASFRYRAEPKRSCSC